MKESSSETHSECLNRVTVCTYISTGIWRCQLSDAVLKVKMLSSDAHTFTHIHSHTHTLIKYNWIPKNIHSERVFIFFLNQTLPSRNSQERKEDPYESKLLYKDPILKKVSMFNEMQSLLC